MHFNFVGDLSLPRETAKRPFVRNFDKNGRKMKSMTFAVRSDRTNMGFVELFGSQQDVIKAYDTENNPIDIDWADRKDPDVIASVRPSNQYIAHLGADYGEKRFLSAYDMIEYLEENLPNIKDKISVTGQSKHDFYNGQTRTVYQFKNVYAVEPERKNMLVVRPIYYWSAQDVDVDKETGRINLNGYVQEYINRDNGTKFVAQPIVLTRDMVKEDMPITSERHKHLAKLISRATKAKNKVFCAEIVCNLKNGSEEVPFDESQLTEEQKAAIDLGLNTLDDFRPRGQILGQRVTELRISNFNLNGNYSSGPVDTEMKISEFEENIYVPPTTERLDDIMPKPTASSSKKASTSSGYGKDPDEIEIDDDDLF